MTVYTNQHGETCEAPQTVRGWRLFFGLSQQELATRAGISMSSATSIERHRHIPSVAIARKVARALGVSLDDVLWPDEDTVTRPERRGKGDRAA